MKATSVSPPGADTSDPATDDGPKISIGMPVYNGADTIGRAIAGIQAQTFPDFELIISDNGSTDDTVKVCQAAAKADPRIRFLQQDENRGSPANFEAVLVAAQAPYFMFAAADDWMEPHCLAETLSLLQKSVGAVACTPRTLIHFANGHSREAKGTRPITLPTWMRPAFYLVRPADNSRYYGLYQTRVMQAAFPMQGRYFAYDWTASALTLMYGDHIESASIVLHREGAARDKYSRMHLRSSPNWPDLMFPLARMSWGILSKLAPSQWLLAVPALLILNLRQSAEFLLVYLRSLTGR